MLKSIVAILALSFAGCATVTASKGGNTGPDLRHPDLDAAEEDIRLAVESMRTAEQLHHFDMGGHAFKATDLLHQAKQEIEAARKDLDGEKEPDAVVKGPK